MILVAALDGFDPDLAARFEAEGRLPNLAAMRAAGLSARLRSTHPPVSLPAWTSFLTGTDPGTHGLFDFTRLVDGRIHFQSALDRQVPSFLELLDTAGARVASIGVPGTYPVSTLRHGVMLSGFDSPLSGRPDARGMHPLPLWEALHRSGLDLRASSLPEGHKGRGWHTRAAREIRASIERRTAQALALLERGPWDLLIVHFQAADTAGHHFFRYFDPGSPRYAPGHEERACVIPDVYAGLDQALGRLLDAAPAATRCVALSDHGMGPASDCVVHLNRWLELEGFLVRRRDRRAGLARILRKAALRYLPRELQARIFRLLRQTAVASLETRVRLAEVDLERSAAFSEESSTLPGIWLRDSSRRDELVRRLQGWEAVLRVHTREELYQGATRGLAPDLLLDLRHSLVRTPAGYAGPSVRRLEDRALDGLRGAGLNGVHRPDGILIADFGGSGAARNLDPWIGDLAPTLLAALGVEVPAWMEGHPIEALAAIGKHLPRDTPLEGEARAPSGPPLDERESAEIEQRLRALGYLS